MAEKLAENETVSLEEVVISHSYEMVALIKVLEKKGILHRSDIVEEIQNMRKAGV